MKKWKYFKMLINYLKPYRVPIVIALIFIAINQVCMLYLPNLMAKIIDIGIKQHGFEDPNKLNASLSQAELISNQTNYIFRIGWVMILITIISIVFIVISNYLFSKISAKVSNDLRKDLYSNIMKFSLSDINEISVSSLITRTTNDAQKVNSFIFSMTSFIMPIILMAGGVISIIQKNISLTPVVIIGSAISTVIIFIIFKFTMPKIQFLQTIGDKFNLIIKERLSGITTMRTFVNENFEQDKFKNQNDELIENSLYVSKIMTSTIPIIAMILNLMNVYIIWTGAKEINNSTMAVGDVIASSQYVTMVMMSFLMFTFRILNVPKYWVSVERTCKILDKTNEKDPTEIPSKIYTEEIKKIEFRNVSFKYPGAEEYIIKNVNFVAKKGETIGIIGTTGCGKSTLVRLLAGFLKPTEGKILFNDKEITPNDNFTEKVGYVAQNAPLFSGDVEYNLKIANPNATKEDLICATKDAAIYKFIEENGFDKNILGANFSVSGGQRQRLAIARAILKKTDVYVFDDSFSKLDFKTDLEVRQNLSKRIQDSITFIVSQRIGTIKNANQIIVLDQGDIVGQGEHISLTLNCNLYREIVNIQTKIKSDKE